MSDSKFAWTVFLILLIVAGFLICSEIVLCVTCCSCGFHAACRYAMISKHVRAYALPPRDQFSEVQRHYWRFVQSLLPFQEGRDETEQWLENNSGRRSSLWQTLWGDIRKIAYLLVALMIWPCAMLIHGLFLGIRSCFEP